MSSTIGLGLSPSSSSGSGVASDSGWAAGSGAIESSRATADSGAFSLAGGGSSTVGDSGVDSEGFFALRFFFWDFDKGAGGGAPGTIRWTTGSGILVSGGL